MASPAGKEKHSRKEEAAAVVRAVTLRARDLDLNSREVFEMMWREDPDGGCTKASNTHLRPSRFGGRTMVEVGCGSGKHLKLGRKAARYVGIDISFAAARQLLWRNPKANVVQADARFLPLREGCSQLTFSFEVIKFVGENVAEVGREISRITRQGGRVAFSTIHSDVIMAQSLGYREAHFGKLFDSFSKIWENGVIAYDMDGAAAFAESIGLRVIDKLVYANGDGRGVEIASIAVIKAVKR